MGNDNIKFFDMPALLQQGDLNTRKYASDEPAVSVEEYFDILYTFLWQAPGVERALNKFANIRSDKDDYRSLDIMVNLLSKIGCERFVFDFHELLNAYGKKGNWREAAAHAKRIIGDFKGFHDRIRMANVLAGSDDSLDLSMPLSSYIEYLDYVDANRKPLILAVDDSPVILRTVTSVLSNDYKVFTLPKPTELKKVLLKLTPELFLLDYLMPELNGFDLVPIIRSFDEHKETPIVFLTSEGTLDNITAAVALGASDFIVKPFRPDILREKITNLIMGRRNQDFL